MPTTQPPVSGDFWATVRAALRGTGVDLTSAPIGQAIILLAVPMVLEMVMESVFAVADILFVSRLGAEAVAVVGLTESVMTIVFTIAMGLSIGVTAMVARRTGERDPHGASLAAGQGVVLGALVAAALGVLGVLYHRPILEVMGAEASVVDLGSGYAAIMLGGNATVLLLFMLNAVFRGAGDAAIAMRVLWIANGINLVLDPCLIFGLGPFPELGVTGAAVATNIGRGTAVVIQLVVLLRGLGRVRVLPGHLGLHPVVMKRLVKLSGSGTFQILVSTASWLGLVRIVSTFGSEALAGYTIGIRLVIFALLPAWGMANAASTMVGQALGAGKPERAEQSVWIAGRLNLFFLGAVGVAFMVFARPIVSLFGDDPLAASYAVDALRIVAAGFFFYAYGMVLTQSFNGAGDTWTPTWINLLCFWVLELPLAYLLAHPLGLGPRGVWLAITVAFSTVAVVSALIFRRGRWKAVAV